MRDLIVFGEDFGGLPSSTQHLVTRLAKQRKVLWVNSIGLRQPKLNRHDIQRAALKLLGRAKGGYHTSHLPPSNITVVNIKTIPAPRSRFARLLAKWMTCQQLRPIIRQLNLNSPILWSSLPTTADLCGHLGESAVVYYCGDDFSALAGVDHDVVQQHENKLAQQADLIFAASSALLTKFPPSKSHYLPHGVDTQLFSTPCQRAVDLPSRAKKTAGFYGSLSNWLDYPLIHQICADNPDWEFVFIGPIELNHNPLPRLPNVHYLGTRPHDRLPSYSQHWNVSLLPFVQNSQIASCSPLKLLEYLAAGSAVISTSFPALSPYRQSVTIADSAEAFSAALAQIACTHSPLSSADMSHLSWDARTMQLTVLLEAL
ncbi:glycosyltransferase family 1 protein [Vibrio sp. JPW-9-11-11]|uniref:glycosyltransferase n=1 Tax=Vibrio sp. JPW-9-11-11 TaxID=1416532 RepID=UPI001593118E|nr:glycosyltransferase [Vibrio sp. JPW-9-11-11]NVD06719.1 glycosyltransferase family 1 protein [Vibrio sp. JPW-9-11-11]